MCIFLLFSQKVSQKPFQFCSKTQNFWTFDFPTILLKIQIWNLAIFWLKKKALFCHRGVVMTAKQLKWIEKMVLWPWLWKNEQIRAVRRVGKWHLWISALGTKSGYWGKGKKSQFLLSYDSASSFAHFLKSWLFLYFFSKILSFSQNSQFSPIFLVFLSILSFYSVMTQLLVLLIF